jgi:hypothetical protein
MVGVYFSYDEEESNKLNFEEKNQEVETNSK